MANYECAVRTNYFHVNNEQKFKEYMEKVVASDDVVHVWEGKDQNGNPVFGFGCYGPLLGLKVPSANMDDTSFNDDYDYDFDLFLDGLARFIEPDDAVIILESGHEKLRYLSGSALIVTKYGVEFMEIDALAARKAAEMLNNPGWQTQMFY